MLLTVPSLIEGVWSRRGHVGLRSGVVICTRSRVQCYNLAHMLE